MHYLLSIILSTIWLDHLKRKLVNFSDQFHSHICSLPYNANTIPPPSPLSLTHATFLPSFLTYTLHYYHSFSFLFFFKKKGRPRATCADETLRLINALQANNWDASKVYKPYVVEADKCMEKAAADRKKRKLNTLHHLQKYVTQRK